tara:strand:- start:2778 stop:3041 length:264 start_codon:yes stop_codon:yes gene_type:complete
MWRSEGLQSLRSQEEINSFTNWQRFARWIDLVNGRRKSNLPPFPHLVDLFEQHAKGCGGADWSYMIAAGRALNSGMGLLDRIDPAER